jgi:hypothetical protein
MKVEKGVTMLRINKIDKFSLSIALFIVISVLQTIPIFGAEKPKGKTQILEQKPQIFKIEQMTKDQFKALPDSAIIEFKGKQMTKGQFISEMNQKSREMAEKAKAEIKSKGMAEFEARRAKLLQQEKQRIAANNAKARAEFERLKQQASSAKAKQFAAIRQEAIQLNNKSKNANPAEQAQIEKRAGELIQELKQLGYGGALK